MENSPVLKAIDTANIYKMFEIGDKVLVALSGGPDSIFLLHILNDYLRGSYNLKLHIAHLNHGIRGKESDRDEEFTVKTADSIGIETTVKRIDAYRIKKDYGTSLESACHFERISFFKKTAQTIKADKIAIGHTLDDRVESFFMNALRGTGLSGLKGISPVNRNYRIVRPLIDITKDEIVKYLHFKDIAYIKDSTNSSDKYERNLIRKKLIPAIEDIKPSFRNALKRTMDNVSTDDDFIKEICERELPAAAKKKDEYFLHLNKAFFDSLHNSIGKRLLILLLEDFKTPRTRISRIHIDEMLKFIEESSHGQQFHLPSGIRAVNSYGDIYIRKEKEEKIRGTNTIFFNPPETMELEEFHLTIKSTIIDADKIRDFKMPSNEAILDFDKLSLPLKIRKRQNGDIFHPLGAKGKKKLKDFFIGLKIPKQERDDIPLIISDSAIVWVAGLRISEQVKVTEQTKKVLRLEITKINRN